VSVVTEVNVSASDPYRSHEETLNVTYAHIAGACRRHARWRLHRFEHAHGAQTRRLRPRPHRRCRQSPPVDGQTLAQIRAATAHYQRLEEAIADGFVRGSACISSVFGGKGYAYQKPALFDGIVDPAAPEILNYEPMENGRMRLVSVAFIVPAASWDPFHPLAPTLGDQSFLDRRVAGSFGPPFANYALYASVWRNNPRGMFDQYNPNVSCDFAADAVIELIRATSVGRSVYPLGKHAARWAGSSD
jgi:hypothetical protein